MSHVLGLSQPAVGRLGLSTWVDDDGPPAAIPALLFCGRRRLSRDRVERCFSDDTVLLESIGLLERDGDRAVAPVAIVPVRDSLSVAPWDRLPDDSSLHLVGALPSSASSWLDIGTGAAFAPLAAPALAPSIVGADIDAESIALAEIGVALSGADHIELRDADLLDVGEAAPSLITFNAPIAADLRDLMARFWDGAAERCAPGGEVLAHCRADAAIPPTAAGEVVVARYTPNGSEAFVVVRWHPHRPTSRREIVVNLGPRRPHVRRDWISRDDPS